MMKDDTNPVPQKANPTPETDANKPGSDPTTPPIAMEKITTSAAVTPPPVGKKEDSKPILIKEPITLPILIQQLLKSPLNVIHSINRNAAIPWLPLTLFTLAGFAVFGLVLGFFNGGNQLWSAPLKISTGIFFSALICLPSLYIFGNLCGIDAKLRTYIGLLLSMMCITSLLLLGFAPVLWLFSTSSSSIGFFGFLSLAVWLVCFAIGVKTIKTAAKHLGAKKVGPLEIWLLIFTLVTLQMPTTLRPIIAEPDTEFINLSEKKFFLFHWMESVIGKPNGDLYSDDYHR